MKSFVLVWFILLLFVPFVVSARSGCCSHHGGVCGCGCCDGTGLSATCAPYYPKCSSPSTDSGYKRIYDDSGNPVNSNTPVNQNIVETPSIQKSVTVPVESSKSEDNGWLGWVVGVGVIGGIGYFIGKNKRK